MSLYVDVYCKVSSLLHANCLTKHMKEPYKIYDIVFERSRQVIIQGSEHVIKDNCIDVI